MMTHPLEARSRPRAVGRCRFARRLAGSASVAVLTMLGACAGPDPLVAGGHLTAGLAALAPSESLSAELWLAPTLGPAGWRREAPDAPLPALRPAPLAPRPPPRKPVPEPHIVWLPALKPVAPQEAALARSAPPPLWPAPAKPSDLHPLAVIEPAAGLPDDRVTAPVTVVRGRRAGPQLAAAVSVADPDALLPQLDLAAREALLAGDASTALQLYEQASELFPNERGALLGRALALQQLGRDREAQAIYQVLLDEDASDLGARIALLGVLAERAPDEALRLLRRLARYHPKDARLPAQMAVALARKGDLAAALGAQRRAVALAPNHPGHQVNLAVLYDRAGLRNEAVRAYRSALELSTLTGAPSAQLGQIAARLEHLSALQRPRPIPAQAPR